MADAPQATAFDRLNDRSGSRREGRPGEDMDEESYDSGSEESSSEEEEELEGEAGVRHGERRLRDGITAMAAAVSSDGHSWEAEDQERQAEAMLQVASAGGGQSYRAWSLLLYMQRFTTYVTAPLRLVWMHLRRKNVGFLCHIGISAERPRASVSCQY